MTQLLDYLTEKYQPESFDEVNRRLLELSSLFEISQLINSSLELNSVLNNILFIPMGRMLVSRGAIILKPKKKYQVVMSKGIGEEIAGAEFEFEAPPGDVIHLKEDNVGEFSELKDFADKANLQIAIPFVSNNLSLGLMLFGAKLNGQPFSDEELDFLKSLANISASTIENALKLEEITRINLQLDGKVQELRTLFDIGRGLSATLEYNKILKLLGYALMGQMLLTRYAILLLRDNNLTVHENKGFPIDPLETICGNLTSADIRNAEPITTLRPVRLRKQLQKIGTECLIPMRHHDKNIGFILLGPKISKQPYGDTDLEFLSTLVSQAVISLENARLFEETLEKQRLEEELNVARNIQRKLLPKKLPEIEGYELAGMNTPSKQVGGDYYDVIAVDDHRTVLAIADVSGKGVPASLLMANLQAGLRVMISPELDLKAIVGKLNQLIHANTDMDKFITFFVGVLDTQKHTFEYVNAGHNNPHFYSQDQDLAFLDEGGILLGIMPHYTYKSETIDLKKGDLVITYTDGVNEALDPSGEEFGDDRLNPLTTKLRHTPCQQLVETLWETIDRFSDYQPQADDVTMLVFRRLK